MNPTTTIYDTAPLHDDAGIAGIEITRRHVTDDGECTLPHTMLTLTLSETLELLRSLTATVTVLARQYTPTSATVVRPGPATYARLRLAAAQAPKPAKF